MISAITGLSRRHEPRERLTACDSVRVSGLLAARVVDTGIARLGLCRLSSYDLILSALVSLLRSAAVSLSVFIPEFVHSLWFFFCDSV